MLFFKLILLDRNLYLLFQIFSHATNHLSQSQYPTLATSIPIYNWLLDKIEDFHQGSAISDDMKKAALQAMEKIKTYYQKTDAVVFTAATLIDPWLKLSYYEEHKWEKI